MERIACGSTDPASMVKLKKKILNRFNILYDLKISTNIIIYKLN